MGIPSHQYIKEQHVPNGYEIVDGGKVKEGDKVWSTSEGVWLDIETFDNYVGDTVDDFYRICRIKNTQ